jgi:hypothetical protein
MEFGKLQSSVKLDLSTCFELGCLPDSIVDLSQLKTFDYSSATNWKISQWSWGNFKAWWNSTYLVVSSWGVDLIQLWTCHNSKHFDFECATNWRICKWQIGAFF